MLPAFLDCEREWTPLSEADKGVHTGRILNYTHVQGLEALTEAGGPADAASSAVGIEGSVNSFLSLFASATILEDKQVAVTAAHPVASTSRLLLVRGIVRL
jgi:hypothetical protein